MSFGLGGEHRKKKNNERRQRSSVGNRCLQAANTLAARNTAYGSNEN